MSNLEKLTLKCGYLRAINDVLEVVQNGVSLPKFIEISKLVSKLEKELGV